MRRAIDKPFFIANFDKNVRGVAMYFEPVVAYGNYQPLSGYTEVAAFGERITKMYRVLLDKRLWQGKIIESDLAYLEGVTPDGEVEHGAKANYMVVSVREQNTKIAITLEKRQV